MPQTLDDFSNDPMARWRFVADEVMGGVSTGEVSRVETDDGPALRLTGLVRLENDGGFIQFRRDVAGGFPADAAGLRLSVRGNGESYYVFLRTKGQARVFHSYRHSFPSTDVWREVEMPFADFTRSHAEMAQGFTPDSVTGLGIVAYGRAFRADVSVRRIDLF